MAKPIYRKLVVKDIEIPIKVYRELRTSVRISAGAKELILRTPNFISNKKLAKYLEWSQKWFENKLKKQPGLINQFQAIHYRSGDQIQTYIHTYSLNLVETQNKTSHAILNKDKLISIYLNSHLSPSEKQTSAQKLIRKVIANDHLFEITERVHSLNAKYFKKEIGRVRLKYNTSNWGSCSAKRNINLSTRLLFAPVEIQNYVIIHELAHLVELNHSPRFWQIIKKIDPAYKQKEKWLKKNSIHIRI